MTSVTAIVEHMATETKLGVTGRTVARNLRRIRQAQGISLRDLSARLRSEHINRPISPEGLHRIENAAPVDSDSDDKTSRPVRRVDVDDLMALALALNTSPVALLVGAPTHAWDPVDITGLESRYTRTAADVWRWATGDDPALLDEGADPAEIKHKQALYRAYARPWWVSSEDLGLPDGTRIEDLWAVMRYTLGDQHVTPEDFPDQFPAQEVQALLRYAEARRRFKSGEPPKETPPDGTDT